jgi:putative ABC transport system permease protein
MGIRAALGADRGRIVRQLLTESIVLGLTGGTLGLLLATWGVRALVRLNPPNIPRLDEASSLDPKVVGFTFLVALLASVVFGLSLILPIGAGLLIRSFLRLQEVDLGFQPDHVLTLQLTLPRLKFPDEPGRLAFFRRIVEKVETLPGVRSAALVSQLPLTDDRWSGNVSFEGLPVGPQEVPPEVDWRSISPGYLSAMAIPIVRGRGFTPQDPPATTANASLAVIDQAMAHRFFSDRDPIGKRLKLGAADTKNPWLTIIGVVGNVKQRGLNTEDRELIYVNYFESTAASLVVRTAADPRSLANPVKAAVQSLDPDVPTSRVATMSQLVQDSLSRPRFNLVLLGILAAIALILALVGMYGVISYSISQRSHEIGIRMALGATQGNVLAMVVRSGLQLAIAGIVIGLAVAFALTRLMSSLLYGVSATDLGTFLAVPLLLAAVAWLASYLPARRATQIPPMVVLRRE